MLLRRTYRLLLFICFLGVINSCKQATLPYQASFLGGHVDQLDSTMLYLVKSNATQNYKNYTTAVDSCQVDLNGYFEFRQNLDSADFYQLRNAQGFRVHQQQIYLSPGDSLVISTNDRIVHFDGHGAYFNRISFGLNDWRNKNDSCRRKFAQRYYMSPKDFRDYRTSSTLQSLQSIENDSAYATMPHRFRQYLLHEIQTEWLKNNWDYLKFHNYYTNDDWTYLSADSIGLDIEMVQKLNPDLHFTSQYASCINGYTNNLYETLYSNLADSTKQKQLLLQKFSIIEQKLHGVAQEIALLQLADEFWIALSQVDNHFYEDAKIINAFFENHQTTGIYYPLFQKKYRAFLNIAPGKKAVDFRLATVNGDSLSLSDFEGKIVYLNFWGTWCGPCIASIDKHLALQQSMADYDALVFMYVALEYNAVDIERWKQMLTDRDWPGVHLVAEKQFHNEQLKPYQITAAPSYILIDANGRIVQPRAEGPASIEQEIRKLIRNKK